MNDTCRVLIVSDKVLRRRLLAEWAGTLGVVAITGSAATMRIALSKLEKEDVDLVLVDSEIDGLNSSSAVRSLQAASSGAGVVMCAAEGSDAARDVVRALESGALDYLIVPDDSGDTDGVASFCKRLAAVVQSLNTRRNVAEARRMTGELRPIAPAVPSVKAPVTPARGGAPAAGGSKPVPVPQRFGVLAIGVSTGGPNALAEVIPRLPADLGVPVLVVQHMPESFTRVLADSLDGKSKLVVREAEEGDVIEPNVVYLAPGGRHMVVGRSPSGDASVSKPVVGLVSTPPRNSCRPSADVLFESVAEVYGGRILALVMTGMGHDGCEGVRSMKSRGCYCLSQSADTCVVYGMPRAVDEAGLSDERVPLSTLAARISSLIKRG